MFHRVLVANRGEIAARILGTVDRLGASSVAVYAEEDRHQPHVRLADKAVRLGQGPPSATYLDAEAIVAAAVEEGADAVHPGYGFLSEAPGFARAVQAAGLTWIGPPPEALEALGDKARALALARELGVATTPGSDGPVEDLEAAGQAAEAIGYPLVVKAVHGGGGMGMVRVTGPDELEAAWTAAREQAEQAFGSPEVLLERWWEAPRHVEVQVAFDQHGAGVHLFERECSLQRRHQKLVEEAPAPGLPDAVRQGLRRDALTLCEAAGVTNLATVEFLVTGVDDGPGYVFNEVNPRLQVEHTVTEEITGQDLVAWQLRIAAGEPLPQDQETLAIDGHAVQARINAEDVLAGFAPSPGEVTHVHVPRGQGVRVDHALVPGSRIAPGYDSLLAKVITHAPDRPAALERLRRALAELTVGGVPTTAGLLHHVLGTQAVREVAMHTTLLEDELVPAYQDRVHGAMAALVATAGVGEDGRVLLDGHEATWERDPDGQVSVDGEVRAPVGEVVNRGSVRLDGRVLVGRVVPGVLARQQAAAAGGTLVVSPIPGTVAEVLVAEGDEVEAGTPVVVVEAMKMKNRVPAIAAGRVSQVLVSKGEQVDKGAGLVSIG